MRPPSANAQLALLLEVASTPTPGNVDRHREYPDLRFEQFLAGAVGTREGFETAADGAPIGEAFERAIAGMSNQRGGNTQFGAVLLLLPLVAAAGRDDLTPAGASRVVETTTVEDAVEFYRAFDHVDVAVGEPPEELAALDVRRGSDAVAAVRDREVTLGDVMVRSADRDGIAAEWTGGFGRTFEAAAAIEASSGPVTDCAAAVFLGLLADEADTFVCTKHGRETAIEVRDRARDALDGGEDVEEDVEQLAEEDVEQLAEEDVEQLAEEDVEQLAEELVAREINPGTTADILAGALFIALERGLEV